MNKECNCKTEKLKLYDALANNCWSLICRDLSNGEDSSVGWCVVGYFMAKPYERVIGECFDEDKPERAIKDALDTVKNDSYAYLYSYDGR